MTIKEATLLLELTAPFSKAALKKAYRDALMVWHPDRFEGNTELKAQAEARTGRINEAYALLSRIPESEYPYRASVEGQQTKQPSSSNPQRATTNQQPQPSSPPQRTSAAPTKQPRNASAKKKTDYLTIAAWVICVPAVLFLMAFISQLQSPKKSSIQKPYSKTVVGEQPFSPGHAVILEEIRVKADQGDREAQFQLGQAYTNGDGVAKDPKEAVKWFQLAADQGHAKAQFNLGFRYGAGDGVPQDSAEAVKWYRKAADQGHAHAQHSLGFYYEFGVGLPQDSAEAVKWYRKAAEQGHAHAQYSLGFYYKSGKGLPKDEAEAMKWYRKAAEQGDSNAQFALALMLTNEVESAQWLQRAAEQGGAEAQSWLGACYANGEGVPKNQIIGHMWLNLANAQGVEKAKKNLLIVEADMTSAQIAEAVKLAAEFKPIKEDGRTPNDVPLLTESLPKIASPTAGLPVQEEMSGDEKDRKFHIEANAWDAEAARAFPDSDKAGTPLSLAIVRRLEDIERTDPEYFLRSPDAGYKLVASEATKLGIAPLSPPSVLPTAKGVASTPELRHLLSDERLTSGSILTDHLTPLGGKGKLSLDNGLTEDAFVKMINNDRLVASFYVRGGEKFTFTHVPDGTYRLIYCTGFGWDAARQDFERGRHAMRYDEALDFTTTRRTEGNSIITSTGVMTLTLHKVANGNARTSGIPLEEFDRY